MNILAIESSCDETSIAIVEDGRHILALQTYSQVSDHRRYGGVVPEVASRKHVEVINPLLSAALEEASLTMAKIDAIAVTIGPGLEGSLLVGMTVAKTLSMIHQKPLIGVNHLHGHLYAPFLTDQAPPFPCIALLVSGGHSMLVHVHDHGNITLLGSTRDDAAGEAFDKVARHLSLRYPGGPEIEKCAHTGNDKAFHYPLAMKHEGYEFSFSGLKTAVIQSTAKLEMTDTVRSDVAASFQKAVKDILIFKSIKACLSLSVPHLLICGGVMANQTIQSGFKKACEENNITLYNAPLRLCTDNAAMIGSAAFFLQNHYPAPLTVKPGLKL